MQSIKELSKEFMVTSRTIRYYEEYFELKSVQKSKIRYYDEKEINKIKIIITFRKLDFSLSDIKRLIMNLNNEELNIFLENEKNKYLLKIKENSQKILLLEDLKKTIDDHQVDNLEEWIINDLFNEYENGKESYLKNREQKLTEILEKFVSMLKAGNVLAFKKFCQEKMNLNAVQDNLINTMHFDKELLKYEINIDYTLYNGCAFISLLSQDLTVVLKFVFDREDIIIGIWNIKIIKHNS